MKKSVEIEQPKSYSFELNPGKFDRVLEEFFEELTHVELYHQLLECPSEDTRENLNQAFQTFYTENRLYRYLTGVIKRYPIDFDKRENRLKHRQPLILDKNLPINSNSSTQSTMKDFIPSPEISTQDFNIHKDILPAKWSNQLLVDSLSTLKPKQIELLNLFYVQGYKNREIGEMWGQTEQNISYWHRKTLNELKRKMSK